MVVKILSSAATFNGIKYNFEKLATGRAELMRVANFGSLQGLDKVRVEDYRNYLLMLTERNTRIKQPQFHAVISTKGQKHTNEELTAIGEKWMAVMGYEKQPYLVFFHKDTDDNHIHIVSTRINRDGKKISSEYEHVRAVSTMNKIMGLDEDQQALKDIDSAKAYRFSTLAQFKLILEEKGYIFQDNNLVKFGKKLAKIDFDNLAFKEQNEARIRQLKAIFSKYSATLKTDDFAKYMGEKHGVKLVFHSKDGKPAYGYTIIDDAQKNVFKGSAIMPLKELLSGSIHEGTSNTALNQQISGASKQNFRSGSFQPKETNEPLPPVRISLAHDVDDEKVHGRRRKKKNTRGQSR